MRYLAILLTAFSALGQGVHVSWLPPVTTNDVTGYSIALVVTGQSGGITNINSGVLNTNTVFGSLLPGTNYTVHVRSLYGPDFYSTPISAAFTQPMPPQGLKLKSVMQSAPGPNGPWQDVTNQINLVTATQPYVFYRNRLEWEQ